MNLLKNIAWRFDTTDYQTREAISAEIGRYQVESMAEQAAWHPDETVIDSTSVDIVYECWPEKAEPLSANETLVAAYADGDYEEREVSVRLMASDGRAFTALDLLYQLHQHLRTKALVDHCFFEGLSSADGTAQSQPPLFFLTCGS